MPVNMKEGSNPLVIALEGIISIEDTDQLFDLLRMEPMPALDLSACEHIHTAPLQLIKMLNPGITNPAPDSFWNRCLGISGDNNNTEESI